MLRLRLVYLLLPLMLFVGGCGNIEDETKYETQHKNLIKAMEEYELSTSKLLTGMSDTEGTEWKDGINQFNKATNMYVIAAGNIVDIQYGNKVGTTEKSIGKISEEDAPVEAETETAQTQPSEQEVDLATKDTQTQPIEQNAEEKIPAADKESVVEQSPQQLTVDNVKEIIEYYSIGENDKLNDVAVENGEIKATIVLASNNLFPAKDMAVNRYSQLSDELLKHEGWQTLSVTYANIGSISMTRNEKETNEIGDYFPVLKIEERLK
ncbi:hypothetical protein BHL27_07335 [Bacillus cereus]|uniref:hypothetical protein n=1 Tax=Bacillus cereus TaxID=1396 RepID=UPI000995D4DF|nr:hypothetical protein [Bacillus cereus]OPA02147.1 hypothetical protein BHL27_07335 [Bacillus cereus]